MPAGVQSGIAPRRASRWPALPLGLAAAIPAYVALVRALGDGWTPEGDRAVVATRAYDVLTGQSPLVGAFSTSTVVTGDVTYSPGPLLYWLLALPVRIDADVALPVAMTTVNVACAVGIVVLAQRRGGTGLAVATAAGVALLWASLRAAAPYDVWAPAAPVLPFALLLWLGWAVAGGEHRLLPVTVVVASFAMHCHLAYVPPSLAVLAIALGGLLVRRPRPPGRWLAAAAAVAVLCWAPPVLDQLLAWTQDDRGPGNLAVLVDAAGSREETAGRDAGAHAVVRAVGVPPWWLRRTPEDPAERTFEVFEAPGALAVGSALLVLAGLVAALVAGARARRRDVVAACALALAACAALGAVTAGFPNEGGTIFSLSYALAWAGPAGLWAWLTLGRSAAVLVGPRLRLAPGAESRPATVAGVVAVAAVGIGAAAAADPLDDEESAHSALRDAVAAVERAVPAGARVGVNGPAFGFEAAIVHALRARGARVHTASLARELGRSYEARGARVDRVVEVHDGPGLPRRARLVARVRVPRAEGRPARMVTIGVRLPRAAFAARAPGSV